MMDSRAEQVAINSPTTLLRRLTLDEKIAMLHQYAPAVPRLGLSPFRTGTEVLHGVAWLGVATVFPQAVGLAASWNPGLLERVGATVADEVRAKHAADPQVSLNVWGPVVNLLRDPRWGRNEEGYSEDPWLTTTLGRGFCRGLRGGRSDGEPRTLKTAPTLKHFLAYNCETQKATRSISVRARVLWEYEIRPFLDLVRAGVVCAVMPAYNAVNGRPNHLSPYLAPLRSEQPDLVVVSDAFALTGILTDLHYFHDAPALYAAAIRAGVDNFTEQFEDPGPTVAAVQAALTQGLLSEGDIDAPVERMLNLRARTGEFDRASPGPDEAASDAVAGRAHAELAREAVRQAVVLLKNDGAALPLRPGEIGRLLVVGPLADRALVDWYSGDPPYRRSPLAGLQDALPTAAIQFTSGLDRIALRALPNGGYLTAELGGADGPLRVSGLGDGATADRARTRRPISDAQLFDLIDWGEGVISLRTVANGRFLSVRADHTVVDDKEEPQGWRVRETFRLIADDAGWLLQNVLTERYASLGPDGSLLIDAVRAGDARRFERVLVVSGSERAAEAATRAEAAVVVVGSHPRINACEGRDRVDIALPAGQEQLVSAVVRANARTIVVIVSGHPMATGWIDAHAPAVVWSCHGGQEFGSGLADILTGRHSPAGRLPQTWYRRLADIGDIAEADIIKHGKTYLYFRGDPLYPFGHGLSYTTFRYTNLRLSSALAEASDTVEVRVDVTNTGTVDGDEVAQLYVRPPGRQVSRPLRELRGVERLHLAAGQTAEVAFALSIRDLTYWDVARNRFSVEPGKHLIMVGRSSVDIAQRATLTICAEPSPGRDLSTRLVRASDFDDYHEVRLADETGGSGEAVEAIGRGSWLLYRDAVLSSGTGHFVARVCGTATQPATIVARLDNPIDGAPVATVAVPPAGPECMWTTITCPARWDTGRHDVYLVFTAPARIATFGFLGDFASAPVGDAS